MVFQFTYGDKVEVSSNQDGFIGSYYQGTIIKTYCEPNKHLVRYKEFLKDDLSGDLLTELTDISDIRPYPPTVKMWLPLQVGDVVDAFDRDGWWIGVLVEVCGATGYVRFDDYDGMVVGYQMMNIRVHLDWDGKEWWPANMDVLGRVKNVVFEDWELEH